MKLRIIVSSLGYGGAEHFSVELFKKLYQRGTKAKLQILTNTRQEIPISGPDVNFINCDRVIKSMPKLIYLRIKNYDELWLSTGLQSNIVVFLVCFLTGCLGKLVLRFNNPFEYDLNIVKPSFIKTIIARNLKRCRKIIFQSEGMKSSYERAGLICNSEIIPNFSDRSYTMAEPCRKKIYLFNVARIVNQKDHFFLINVVFELKKLGILCQLTIYGDGPGTLRLKNKVTELCLEKEVALLGNMAISEIILPKNAIYVQSSNFEGFPNSIIEALNSNLRVFDFTDNFKSEYLEQCVNYRKFEKEWFSAPHFLEQCSIEAGEETLDQTLSIKKYIIACL